MLVPNALLSIYIYPIYSVLISVLGLCNKKSSFIWDHFNARHKDDLEFNPEKDIKFSVLSIFRDPMSRQLMEAVKIQRAQDKGTFQAQGEEVVQVLSLNRKYEHFAPQQRREKFY